MLYVSDILRLNEGILGITDTEDNVTEYVSLEDIQKSGLEIKGYSDKGVFTAIPYLDNDAIYLGDYIAPPICSVYGIYNDVYCSDKTIGKVEMFNLIYRVDGELNYSFCWLHITKDLEEKYRTYAENHRLNSGYGTNNVAVRVDKKPKTRQIISWYFHHALFVEVELTVLTNKEKLGKVLNMLDCDRVHLIVPNIGSYFELSQADNACVSVCGVPMICNNIFTDVFHPNNINANKNRLDDELREFSSYASAHLSKGAVPQVFKSYWYDFMNTLYDTFGDNTYVLRDSLSGFRVDLSREHISGDQANSYTLKAFSEHYNYHMNNVKFLESLSEYYPAVAKDLQDKIAQFVGKSKYCLYITLDGVYLVRDKILEIIRVGDNTHLSTLKTKLKLVSDTVRIESIAGATMNIMITGNPQDSCTKVDLVALLKNSGIGSITSLNISSSGNYNQLYLTLPKGIEKITGNNFAGISKDNTIVFETTSKSEIKSLLTCEALNVFNHKVYSDDLKPYVLGVLLNPKNHIKSTYHYNVEQVLLQDIFDLLPYEKLLTEEQKSKLILKVSNSVKEVTDNVYYRYERFRRINVKRAFPNDFISALKSSGLLQANEDLFDIETYWLDDRSQATLSVFYKAKAFLGAICAFFTLSGSLDVSNFYKNIMMIYIDLYRAFTKQVTRSSRF